MQAPLTRDQSEFGSIVARILSDARSGAVRPAPDVDDVPFDADLWSTLRDGGYLAGVAAGGDPVLRGLLSEEIGYRLAPVPVAGSVVGAGALLAEVAPDDQLTEAVLSGEIVAAIAVCDEIVVTGSGEGEVLLSGVVPRVDPLRHADRFLVTGPQGLFVVRASADGLERRPHRFDLTVDVGGLGLHDVPAHRLASGTSEGTGRAIALIRLARACEAVGAARRCLDLTVEHLTVRHQFGRPLGTFQALQHRCAIATVEFEAALSAVRRACRAEAGGDERLAVHVDVAVVSAERALRCAASTAVQLHGGMGFTWEHEAHLYLRRSRAWTDGAETVARTVERIADAVLAEAGRP